MNTGYIAWAPFYGQSEDYGVSIKNIFCETAFDAARQWAIDVDIAEGFRIAGNNESVLVAVKDLSTEEITRWEVIGDCVPEYTARQLSDDSEI